MNISVFSINLILYSIYINYNYSSWSCASLLYCFHKKKYEKYYLEFPLGDNSLPVGVVITYTLFSIHCRHYFEFWAGFALAVGQPKNFQNCGDAIINVKLHSYTSIGREISPNADSRPIYCALVSRKLLDIQWEKCP